MFSMFSAAHLGWGTMPPSSEQDRLRFRRAHMRSASVRVSCWNRENRLTSTARRVVGAAVRMSGSSTAEVASSHHGLEGYRGAARVIVARSQVIAKRSQPVSALDTKQPHILADERELQRIDVS